MIETAGNRHSGSNNTIRKIKADLHNHFTTKSRVLDPHQVADRVLYKLGAGGLCALVNYRDRRYEAFAEQAQDLPLVYNFGNAIYFQGRDVLIIKGQEFPVAEGGDLLAIGLKENIEIPEGKSLEYSLKEVLDKGGINIITTPYFKSNVGDTLTGKQSLLDFVDAIEVHDGEVFLGKANKQAKRLYEIVKNDYSYIGQIASSDGHTFREVGSSYTEMEMPLYQILNSSLSVKEALRKAVRGSQDDLMLHKMSSPLGFLLHAGIISTMIIASKAGIQLSKGNPKALR